MSAVTETQPVGNELQWLGLAESARLIRSAQVSPVEILEGILDWIETTGQVTRAWETLAADEARREAATAERAIAAGEDRGPLHGLTYSVKDVIAVRGMPMRAGSKIAQDFVPSADAHVISRMRDAGAICLGKVTTAEFSFGSSAPPASNPWDGRSTPGASSGGSGCAVAAGQGPASIGADCGCSVRMPAALNGCVGMRPTYGRVGTTGSIPLSMSVDTIGPLARSSEDVALLLGAMAGLDPRDPTSADVPVPNYSSVLGEDLDGMTIGVPRTHFFEHLEEGVESAVRDAIATLEELGMRAIAIDLPHVCHALAAFRSIVFPEGAALLDEYTDWRGEDYTPDVRSFAELGSVLLAKDYCRAQQVRTLIRQDFVNAFRHDGVDVIVVPTTAATAKVLPDDPAESLEVEYDGGYRENVMWSYCRYTIPVSLSSCPALSTPCGFGENGLPVGMQVVSPPFGEATSLRVGHAFERATDFIRRPARIMEAAGAATG